VIVALDEHSSRSRLLAFALRIILQEALNPIAGEFYNHSQQSFISLKKI
jgi:hypothetical protein